MKVFSRTKKVCRRFGASTKHQVARSQGNRNAMGWKSSSTEDTIVIETALYPGSVCNGGQSAKGLEIEHPGLINIVVFLMDHTKYKVYQL